MSDAPLTARRPDFGPLDASDLDWTPHAPEFALAANAVSMQMPHVEPLFARIVRRHLDSLSGDLATEARIYCQQEIAHHQAHHRIDGVLMERYGTLERINRWSALAYGAVERRCSPSLQLGIAAGGEALAYSAARWVSANHSRFIPDPSFAAAPVYLWHLAEEVEHKSVAYDVWRARSGSRRHLALGMVLISLLLIWFTALGLATMMWSDRTRLGVLSGGRVMVWSVSLGMEVLPNMAAALSRSHSPRDFVDPIWLEQWMAGFLAASDGTSSRTTVEPCPSPASDDSCAVSTATSSTLSGSMDGTTDRSTRVRQRLAASGPWAHGR